jgi:hypothetical protein
MQVDSIKVSEFIRSKRIKSLNFLLLGIKSFIKLFKVFLKASLLFGKQCGQILFLCSKKRFYAYSSYISVPHFKHFNFIGALAPL